MKNIISIALASIALVAPSAQANLINRYNNEQAVGWDSAQYVNSSGNVRYQVLDNGDLYRVGHPNLSPGTYRIQNVYQIETGERNTCYLGTNYQCLSSRIYTQTQYEMTNTCELVKYTSTRLQTTSAILNSDWGSPKRKVIGSCLPNYSMD